MPAVTPRTFKGTRDFLPDTMVARSELLGRIRETFELFGFAPMETPALEYLETLSGKYGDEGEKLIYRLAYKGGNVLALRYDLTIPLARVAAQNPNLMKPFKRYQIQPVWRADRPQIKQGRFREFVQCDADTVGTESPVADAEILAMTVEILQQLDLGSFTVRLNHRHVLAGLVEAAGFPEGSLQGACRGLDKWDKVGRDGVREELLAAGFGQDPVDRLLGLVDEPGTGPRELLEKLKVPLDTTRLGGGGIRALEEIYGALDAFGVPVERVRFWPSLARGLDYYTGPIFESFSDELKHVGSLTGGGRYDDLIGIFGDQKIPATGTTIGIERILSVLEQSGRLEKKASRTQVFVPVFDEESKESACRLAGLLRRAGFRTEVSYDPQKLKRQFARADRMGYSLAVIQGPEERKEGVVSIKDLGSGEQAKIAADELVSAVAQRLSARPT